MDDGVETIGEVPTEPTTLDASEPLTLPATDESEAAGNAEEPPREPLALETALSWLAQIKAAAVLTLLRDPKFAFVSVTAFAGFRVNPTSYANPLVRGRLAKEAVRDDKFADKLRALVEAPSLPSSGIPSTGTPEGPPAEGERGQGQSTVSASLIARTEMTRSHRPLPPSAGGPSGVAKPNRGTETDSRLQTLKTERDRRRRERDEARQALAEAGTARQEAERLRQQAEAERDEANQQAQRQARRIARLERQVLKLQAEQTGLLKALRQRDPSPAGGKDPAIHRPTSGPAQALPQPTYLQINPWQAAVAHLLDKRRYDLALSLAQDVLRSDPDNPDALDIAAQGQGAKGETREAAALLRRRLEVTLARGERAEAGDVLLRLLLLAPADHERDLRPFLSGLRMDDTLAIEQARTTLARLRGLAPETHALVAAAAGRLAPTALVHALMPPPGLLGPEDPLPLGLGGSLSARQLLRAVDTGHVDLVEGARAALARLGHADPATRDRVRQALEQASGGDPTYLAPLFGTRGRGPAVVDGSNAAWFDQESMSSGRPRLQSLLGLRRALRARGYFPTLLYADAPLPYTVDEPDAVRGMVDRGELSLVDGGVDADEILLREAKRLDAPLITNDYMADWDPNNEVLKIHFTISLGGEAYLLSE